MPTEVFVSHSYRCIMTSDVTVLEVLVRSKTIATVDGALNAAWYSQPAVHSGPEAEHLHAASRTQT